MGYRSDGGLIIYGPEAEMTVLLTTAKMLIPNHKYLWDAESGITLYKMDDKLVYHLEFSEWKWSPFYADIQCFERLWELAQGREERGLSGVFWRLGEDDNDNERRWFGDEKDIAQLNVCLQVSYTKVYTEEVEGSALTFYFATQLPEGGKDSPDIASIRSCFPAEVQPCFEINDEYGVMTLVCMQLSPVMYAKLTAAADQATDIHRDLDMAYGVEGADEGDPCVVGTSYIHHEDVIVLTRYVEHPFSKFYLKETYPNLLTKSEPLNA